MNEVPNEFLAQMFECDCKIFELLTAIFAEKQKKQGMLRGYLGGLGVIDPQNPPTMQDFSPTMPQNFLRNPPRRDLTLDDFFLTDSNTDPKEKEAFLERQRRIAGMTLQRISADVSHEPTETAPKSVPTAPNVPPNASGTTRTVQERPATTALVATEKPKQKSTEQPKDNQKINKGVKLAPPASPANESQVMSGAQNPKNEEDEDLKYLTMRKDGRWQASKVIDGKRHYVYGKTQAAAREKLRALTGRKSREPKRDSFYVFAMWWLDVCKKGSIANSTMKTYKMLINAHLKIKTPINKVTLQQLQELLSKLPGTRIREEVYKLIRPIMKKAYELDYIKKDYSLFLEVGKVQKIDRRALTIDEQKMLVGALLQNMDMFSRRTLFYLCTGARPSEITGINKAELRDEYVKINGTKTDGAVRWVKISPPMRDMIAGESKEFFAFTMKRYRMRLQDFCKELGMKYDIDVYTLRHTFATNLYILRIPEKDRQVYLGHKPGSKITNDVYTTYSPDISAVDIYNIYGDYLPKF